jgi:hypothetical protein
MTNAVDLTSAVAAFIRAQFETKLRNEHKMILPSIIIPTQLVADCERASNVLVMAFRNDCEY